MKKNYSITVLGGVGEIGMNFYLYETATTALLIDAGILMTREGVFGVDYALPSFNYIKSLGKKFKGIVISHSHEDHIGGLNDLLKETKLQVPIYSGKLGCNILKRKLDSVKNVVEYNKDSSLMIGDISVEFIPVAHSTLDTFAVILKNKDFTIVHMSDYQIGSSKDVPAFQKRFREKLAGTRNRILLADSTNACSEGYSGVNADVAKGLEGIIKDQKGRIFTTTFASNIERIQTILDICAKYNRKVCFVGGAFVNTVATATQINYLKYPNKNMVVNLNQSLKVKDENICYFVSGSQGEHKAVLSSICRGERKTLNIKKGDCFIFSSKPIPGNEKSINDVINGISKAGGKVFTNKDATTHISGHAYKKEIAALIRVVRPKYFLPVHGEHTHLASAVEIAKKCGVKESSCFIVPTGNKIIFEEDTVIQNKISLEKNFYDSSGRFAINENSLNDRKRLAFYGGVVIFIKRTPIRSSDDFILTSLGFDILAKVNNQLSEKIKGMYNSELADKMSRTKQKKYIAGIARKAFYKTMNRKPSIRVIYLEKNNGSD